jgi:hypothetical protein
MCIRWGVWSTALAILASVTLIAAVRVEATASSDDLAAFITRTMADASAAGFVHVRDVRSGAVLAHVDRSPAGGPDPTLGPDTPQAPLSVIKVLVAAAWLEHGFGETAVQCTRPQRRMLVEEMLVSGCDSAGADMAIQLRRRIGPVQVLDDLRADGVAIRLRADAPDEEWGRVLTLGEEQVPVTPARLSAFFAHIGSRGDDLRLVSAHTRLVTALQGVVARGTAAAIKDALAGTSFVLGGKTGTGPGACADHCNGWFAGLVSDASGGRYVILSFVEGQGLGGGPAARIAAEVAKHLAQPAPSEGSER